jgi:hypothetical protein
VARADSYTSHVDVAQPESFRLDLSRCVVGKHALQEMDTTESQRLEQPANHLLGGVGVLGPAVVRVSGPGLHHSLPRVAEVDRIADVEDRARIPMSAPVPPRHTPTSRIAPGTSRDPPKRVHTSQQRCSSTSVL